ncbi:GAF domain-containing protein [Stenomitos frigidus]|nr:GAF domain-containing protein [Stenomitos frigidus]
MTNQLTNQMQPMLTGNEDDQADVPEQPQLHQLNADLIESMSQRQQSSLLQWFSNQSVRRKYVLGWLTSGVLSVAGIAVASTWFAATVNQLQPIDRAAMGQSLTEKQNRSAALQQLVSQQQLLTIALVLAANTGVMILLYRAIAKPVKQLQQDTQMFSLGAREVRAEVNATDEVGKIAQMFNLLADDAVATESLLSNQAHQREMEAKQARLISRVAGSRARTEQELIKVLDQALQDAKALLDVDRVVIYRFYHDWSGYISTEAVSPGLPIAFGDKIEDACISSDLIEAYRQGRVVATDDVLNAGFHPDHMKLMHKLRIRANLVTPILKDGQLYGLLIAHHCEAPHSWKPSEINFLKELAVQIGLPLDRVLFLSQKNTEIERVQQLYQISSGIRNLLSDQEIYNTTVRSVRETLKTDRAVVYLFDKDWKGMIVAESVEHSYPTALGTAIADPCFAEKYVEKYLEGRVQALEDIHKAGLTECHLAQLEPFKVKANMVAPILAGSTLHGLLVTHQCSHTRFWEPSEITFFREVAAQLGLALDRVGVLHELEHARQQAEQLAEEQRRSRQQAELSAEEQRQQAEEQRHQKEALQQQLLTLLDQVEGAASGNLTVRADVTASEIGTVADFFNAIVESLRQIVVRVKQSATQVNMALGENETTVQQLAVEAFKQSADITQTLSSVDQMTASIQAVAESAHQAALVTRTASTTAEASQMAIDVTVHSIFELRETMSETAHKMKRLGESSQAISKVISLINQIALKTNMLALNAGIEAARAGENGLGFAVVAEEVGELAAQSTSATQEIEQLVEDIQLETRQVIEAMEQSTVQMVEGTRLVEDAKQNLGQLRQLSQETDHLVQSISEATISQTQISQAVMQLMQDLAQVSQRTANSSQQITDSLQETVGIAQALQLSVSTFKVEMPDEEVVMQ